MRKPPLIWRLLGIALIIVELFVLPPLIWGNTWVNLPAAGIWFNRDGYRPASFEVQKFHVDIVPSGEASKTRRYFTGAVDGKPFSMKTTFAAYLPELVPVLQVQETGMHSLNTRVDVWVNPAMSGSWFAREHGLVPRVPGFFDSMRDRLLVYVGLWAAFVGILLVMWWLPRRARRRI